MNRLNMTKLKVKKFKKLKLAKLAIKRSQIFSFFLLLNFVVVEVANSFPLVSSLSPSRPAQKKYAAKVDALPFLENIEIDQWSETLQKQWSTENLPEVEQNEFVNFRSQLLHAYDESEGKSGEDRLESFYAQLLKVLESRKWDARSAEQLSAGLIDVRKFLRIRSDAVESWSFMKLLETLSAETLYFRGILASSFNFNLENRALISTRSCGDPAARRVRRSKKRRGSDREVAETTVKLPREVKFCAGDILLVQSTSPEKRVQGLLQSQSGRWISDMEIVRPVKKNFESLEFAENRWSWRPSEENFLKQAPRALVYRYDDPTRRQKRLRSLKERVVQVHRTLAAPEATDPFDLIKSVYSVLGLADAFEGSTIRSVEYDPDFEFIGFFSNGTSLRDERWEETATMLTQIFFKEQPKLAEAIQKKISSSSTKLENVLALQILPQLKQLPEASQWEKKGLIRFREALWKHLKSAWEKYLEPPSTPVAYLKQ